MSAIPSNQTATQTPPAKPRAGGIDPKDLKPLWNDGGHAEAGNGSGGDKTPPTPRRTARSEEPNRKGTLWAAAAALVTLIILGAVAYNFYQNVFAQKSAQRGGR